MDRTPENERRRRHPHELIGPHCDVYSLGKSIENATSLLSLQYETLKIFRDMTLEPQSRPKLELVYTSDLWDLIYDCLNEDARNRPRLPYLYKETKSRMEYCRALARVEEEDAFSKGIPGCFHSNVLFKKVDRKRYETDPVFRSNYRKANLQPVWEILGSLPPQNPVQGKLDVDLADVARAKVGKGQQRGHLPAHGGKKVQKGREKKKRTARLQQGIRGLLSKMNFFS